MTASSTGTPSDAEEPAPQRPLDKLESIAGSQYTSIAFTERLIEAGVDASVGSVGDAYDTQSKMMLVGDGSRA